ncbi:MAG: rhodanese-like domain-containing protein [Myxococcota bacterium]
MKPGRVSVKFFAANASEAGLDLTPFIGLFHGFIRTAAVPGLLVDVVDYAHVPRGPGVILIGHDVDYALDLEEGRPGLRVTLKRCAARLLRESLADALRRSLQAIRAIEADPATKIRFRLDELQIGFPDRLTVPNREESCGPLTAEIAPVLGELLGDAGYELTATHVGDARRFASLTLRAEAPVDLEAALERLAGTRVEPQETAAPRALPGGSWELEVEALHALRVAGTPHTLLDVREPHEFEICNLGGRLIPLGALAAHLRDLDPDAKIVAYCRSGSRGAQAVAILREAGFRDAWNLRGGILAWIERIDSSLPRY